MNRQKCMNLIFYVSITCILMLALNISKSQSNGENPSVFGYHFYSVLSGSMRPTIETGSLVVVKEVEPASVQPQDVITFSGVNQSLTTHRVMGIEGNDTIQFTTKGDANEVIDPMQVEASQLIGKVVFHLPYMGFMIENIKQNPAVLFIVLVTVMICVNVIKWIRTSLIVPRVQKS